VKAIELIALYYYVCECYDGELRWHCQRFSNNSSQEITDEELLTIYLYCLMYENKRKLTEIHDYAKRYLSSWFPKLPAYATFVVRLNRMSAVFPYLVADLLQRVDRQGVVEDISVLDSFPIMLCSAKRQGKVAREFVDKGYCPTKGIHYWGVKVHAMNFHRPGKLPLPECLHITPGSENDLTAIRQEVESLCGRAVFADKAYSDRFLQRVMHGQESEMLTPIKLVKGECEAVRQFKKAADSLFSTAVSRVRQPIESFFNWLNELHGLQNASKVRSNQGLIVHIFGKVAAALALWVFNP
jgi:Transposase DDE domain